MKKRVLVTGAQGLLGSYLAAHLLESNRDVLVFGIGRSPRFSGTFTHSISAGATSSPAPLPQAIAQALQTDRYHYRSLDLTDSPGLLAALEDIRPDTILHLAGQLKGEGLADLFHANVLATESLVRGVHGAGLGTCRLVLGSTGGVYGPPTELPIRESAPVDPFHLYGVSKAASEGVSRILAAELGLHVVWARIFNVIGPGESERHLCGHGAARLAAIKAGLEPPRLTLGDLSPTRDLVDVRDAARALGILADSGAPGQAYNLASGRETVVGDAIDSLLELSGLRDQVEVVTDTGKPAGLQHHWADIGLLKSLGFEPRFSLEESLRDLWDYSYSLARERAASLDKPSRDANGRSTSRSTSRSPLEVSAPRPASYPVLVEEGILQRLPALLAHQSPGRRTVVLTDDRVHSLYGEDFLRELRHQGLDADAVILPEGEGSKAWSTLEGAIQDLHRLRFHRTALLVLLGGGMVTDVGGFLAAIYLRSVDYINVPTTLLAQHDSAIGGKVAVNMPWAKNFVGAFHHPQAVYSDPRVLGTLCRRNMAAGIAESIKVAITGDEDLFRLLEREANAVMEARDPAVLQDVVLRSSARKIALLDPDPYERDLRRALNLGHTFGHPLEVELAYEGLLHGEAVGFGLAVATAIAARRGVCPADDAERIYSLLDSYGLPPQVPRSRLEKAVERVAEIRLVRAEKLHFVLPTSVASVEIVPEVADEEIREALEILAAHPRLGPSVAIEEEAPSL